MPILILKSKICLVNSRLYSLVYPLLQYCLRNEPSLLFLSVELKASKKNVKVGIYEGSVQKKLMNEKPQAKIIHVCSVYVQSIVDGGW